MTACKAESRLSPWGTVLSAASVADTASHFCVTLALLSGAPGVVCAALCTHCVGGAETLGSAELCSFVST